MNKTEAAVTAVETQTFVEQLVDGDVIVELISDNEVEAAPIEAELTASPMESTAPVYADFQPALELDMVTYAESMPLDLDIHDQSVVIHGAPSETVATGAPAAAVIPLRHTAKHANKFELLAGEKPA